VVWPLAVMMHGSRTRAAQGAGASGVELGYLRAPGIGSTSSLICAG
jgi:hypothetical protein